MGVRRSVEARGEGTASGSGDRQIGQVPVGLPSPMEPTPKQVEEHNLAHMPYQPWCKWCVMGKCPGRRHLQRSRRPQEEVEDGVPKIVMDYMFMSSRDQDKMSPILVIKDMKSKRIFAHAVPSKGAANQWVVKKVVDDIDQLGYGWTRVLIRSDQEPALLDVKRQVREERWKEFEHVVAEVVATRKATTEVVRADLGPVTILEESPVGESSSNGAAENAIRHVQGQFRTLKTWLDSHIGVKLPLTHPIWTWLIEWAAATISRYHVGKDGLTSMQRRTGMSCLAQIASFGEKVLYRQLDAKHLVDKAEPRYSEGIWVGLLPRTNECLIGTVDGVIKADSAAVKRLPEGSKWCRTTVEAMVGYPWQPVPGVEGDHIPIRISFSGMAVPPRAGRY